MLSYSLVSILKDINKLVHRLFRIFSSCINNNNGYGIRYKIRCVNPHTVLI